MFQVFIFASSIIINIYYINKSTYVTRRDYGLPNIFINEEELCPSVLMRLVFSSLSDVRSEPSAKAFSPQLVLPFSISSTLFYLEVIQ